MWSISRSSWAKVERERISPPPYAKETAFRGPVPGAAYLRCQFVFEVLLSAILIPDYEGFKGRKEVKCQSTLFYDFAFCHI